MVFSAGTTEETTEETNEQKYCNKEHFSGQPRSPIFPAYHWVWRRRRRRRGHKRTETAALSSSPASPVTLTVLLEEMQRSEEKVHTSAAPFFRHLLLPSSQQPRNNTTASRQYYTGQTTHLSTIYQLPSTSYNPSQITYHRLVTPQLSQLLIPECYSIL